MNLGVTLKTAEKKFGPALAGRGREEATLSAVRYAAGKGKFAGVAGIRDDAQFYIHFPTPVDWSLLATKKGTPDFIKDLHESGPQGEQGRERLIAQFLEQHAAQREKLKLKQEAATKKALATKQKKEVADLREQLAHWIGEKEASITIGGQSVNLMLKITRDKSGKLKISGSI